MSTAARSDEEAAPPEIVWSHLDLRVVWANLVKLVVSLIPTAVGLLVLGPEDDIFGWWPALIATALGVLGALNDLRRWWVTRYRVTPLRVETIEGKLFRQHRSVPRDRVRTVNLTAKLRHRLAGLRVVTVSTGVAGNTVKLDALRTAQAERLRDDLLSLLDHDRPSRVVPPAIVPGERADGAPTDSAPTDSAPTDSAPTDGARIDSAPTDGVLTDSDQDRSDQDRSDQDRNEGGSADDGVADPPDTPGVEEAGRVVHSTVLSTGRRSWVIYNLISIWGFLMGAFILWSAYWALRTFHVNLLDLWNNLSGYREMSTPRAWAISAVPVFVVGVLIVGLQYFTTYWKFALLRQERERGSYLVTRQGLFRTHEILRDESRIRGMQISRPLLWRWMGLSETKVISTGLSGLFGGADEQSHILPRGPRREALRVAGIVLGPDRPFEQRLQRHPFSAGVRRMVWAVVFPAIIAGFWWLFHRSGAVSSDRWYLPFYAVPVTLLLAFVGYRSLGHLGLRRFLVFRSGVSRSTMTVLQTDAVIGWMINRTLLQRIFGLTTVTAATAAGERSYQQPDVSRSQAIELLVLAIPEASRLVRVGPRSRGPVRRVDSLDAGSGSLHPHLRSRRVRLRAAGEDDASTFYGSLLRSGIESFRPAAIPVGAVSRANLSAFVVLQHDDPQPVGFAAIFGVSAGTARCAVFLDPDRTRGGLGTEVIYLAMNYAFAAHPIDRVLGQTTHASFDRFGLQADDENDPDDILPEFLWFQGRHWDLHTFATERQEWCSLTGDPRVRSMLPRGCSWDSAPVPAAVGR